MGFYILNILMTKHSTIKKKLTIHHDQLLRQNPLDRQIILVPDPERRIIIPHIGGRHLLRGELPQAFQVSRAARFLQEVPLVVARGLAEAAVEDHGRPQQPRAAESAAELGGGHHGEDGGGSSVWPKHGHLQKEKGVRGCSCIASGCLSPFYTSSPHVTLRQVSRTPMDPMSRHV